MKTYYYAVVNKRGNFITTDSKLPIYWNREIAFNARDKYCPDGSVIPIDINALNILKGEK